MKIVPIIMLDNYPLQNYPIHWILCSGNQDIPLYLILHTLGEGNKESPYDRERLWLHSYLVSVCAESFLKNDDPRRSGILMTQGILHDIGKFALHVMNSVMREKVYKFSYSDVIETLYNLRKWEEQIFGVNHMVIGGMLVSKWNLSELICAALELHHTPSKKRRIQLPGTIRANPLKRGS